MEGKTARNIQSVFLTLALTQPSDSDSGPGLDPAKVVVSLADINSLVLHPQP